MLPRHPAVAYLCLVRSMRSVVALAVLLFESGCTTQHTYSVSVVDTHGRPVRQALVRLATVRPWPTGTEKVYVEQGQADENGRYSATTPVVIDRVLADSPDLKHSGYVDFPAPSGNVTVVVR
jgi:hypothetical protein